MVRSNQPGPVLTLSGVALDRTFPFHILVDRDLKVISVGPSMRKLLPQLVPGDSLALHLQASQPAGAETLQRWLASIGELVILRSPSFAHVVLRGTVEPLEGAGLIFLVTAVVPSVEMLRELGLGLRDFALHDSLAELLRRVSGGEGTQGLRQRVEQLRAIVEMGDTGVLYAQADGAILHVNRQLCELFGIDDSHVSGLTLDVFARHLASLLAQEETDRDPLGSLYDMPPRGDGAIPRPAARTLMLALPRRMTLQMGWTFTHGGALILYFRDITSETEVDRMKSEFLSTAAHELRTPLASIFGFAELLMVRKMGPEQQRELLGTIHRQAQLLINLINELLDLSRIESRRGKDFHRQYCRVGTIVDQTIRGLLIKNDRRQVVLRMPHGAEAIMVDPEKTMQALLNVLSNAFKYSPGGGDIELSTELREEGAERYVGIRVSDHGLGMSPEQVGRIFERFWRADPSGVIPGTGLGMSLVKEITELQDGTVQVESALGEGTSVTLWFPLTEDFVLSRPSEVLGPEGPD